MQSPVPPTTPLAAQEKEHRLAGLILAVSNIDLVISIIRTSANTKTAKSRLMNEALYGIRPVCIGMIFAVIIQQSMTNYAGGLFGALSWSAVLIGIVSLAVLLRFKWSIPKTIILAAVLGLVLCGFDTGLPT